MQEGVGCDSAASMSAEKEKCRRMEGVGVEPASIDGQPPVLTFTMVHVRSNANCTSARTEEGEVSSVSLELILALQPTKSKLHHDIVRVLSSLCVCVRLPSLEPSDASSAAREYGGFGSREEGIMFLVE